MAFPSLGAEDPARFLTVTNWYATFTRTLQSSGTYTDTVGCVYNWFFNHAGGISSQFKIIVPPLPGFDPVWSDAGSTNISLNFSIQDTSSQTCDEHTDTYEASSGQLMQVLQWSALRIHVAATNYTLEPGYLVGPYTGTVNGDPFPGSVISWFPPSTNAIIEPLPASGMILRGSRRYALNELSYGEAVPVLTLAAAGSPIGATGTTRDLTGELVLTWTLTPFIEEIEVVVESEQYEDWLPTGNLQEWSKSGEDPLFFTARLRVKDGAEDQVPQSRAKWFKFELLEVSTEPGVCMNWPAKKDADTKPDLRFESQFNQPPVVVPALSIQEDGLMATNSPGDYAAAMVVISSFDFGGYGKLKVTAEVHGQEIVGYWENDPAKEPKPLLLPKRQPESRIADQWKEDQGVSDLADNDDEENDPVGDGHKGDGLTLYEEYRGFSQNLDHLRVNPKKKDLLIADQIGNGRSRNGIQLFAAHSGLEVHSGFWHVELSSREDKTDGWINFNVGPDTPHVVDQHGLVISATTLAGFSQAVSSGEFTGFYSTPGSVDYIQVASSIMTPGRSDFAIEDGINTVRRDGLRVITDLAQVSLAHEIAHGCGVPHHGECDQVLNWKIAPKTGDTNPPPFVVLEQGLNIVLKQEPDTLMLRAPWTTGTAMVTIGVPQGQHSGSEDCFMRYSVAAAYAQRGTNIRFWVHGDELQGISLCDSPIGTGVNLPGRTPQSRYGDAGPGRGNCKGLICVNDLYLRDSSHMQRKTSCP